MNRVRVGQTLAVVGGIAGYLIAGKIVGSTDCGVVSYGSPVPDCSFVESLAFRFENFVKMVGAILLALPGLLFWINSTGNEPKDKPPA